MKQAMGMLLTGRRVPAEEGRQLGFVNEVVPVGEALNAAKAWAAQILEMCPLIRARQQRSCYAGNVCSFTRRGD